MLAELDNSAFRWALKDPRERRPGGARGQQAKEMASIIVDFKDRDKANLAIERKVVWESMNRECVKSFRGRPKCRKCQNFWSSCS